MQCFSAQIVEQLKVEIHYHVQKIFYGDVVLQVKSVKSFFQKCEEFLRFSETYLNFFLTSWLSNFRQIAETRPNSFLVVLVTS